MSAIGTKAEIGNLLMCTTVVRRLDLRYKSRNARTGSNYGV
jgi:hypothetical protein